ncbi:MAG: ATP synthase F0 subunit B [Dehalococcoidia bacterium]|jgi:F-type H+-transporting ATPase subunit b|nr:MAG: ATP synthase F0 subunit B [Dehalococcoidia bacterium]
MEALIRILTSFGVTWPALIAQVVNFVLLLVLLHLFAYKPVMRMLDERSRRIRESMEQTELVKQQTAQAAEETKKRLAQASLEGQEILNRAAKTGEEMRQKTLQDAKEASEALVQKARSEIAAERDEAIDSVRREFADLTILAAEKVISRSLDKKAHQELIDRVLEEGESLKK